MILQNDFKRQWSEIGPAAMAALERVGASGWYILGRAVETFERVLSEFWGVRDAVGVANGMDAIEIALRVLDLRPGQKVLTTPFSAFATTLAILRANGMPVFVDVDDNGNIDLEQCHHVLTRDRAIRFFVPVHLYGNPLDLEKLARLKHDFDLVIIEDCAQAIGAKHGGRHVGSIGQAAATSFYPTKNLGALGDAGALITDDNKLATQARALRNYGQSSLYRHDARGLNSRLDELHAAILGDALLPNLLRWTDARRKTARRYLEAFSDSGLKMIHALEQSEPVWHLFPIFVQPEQRAEWQRHFESCGIRTGIHYPTIIPDQPAIAEFDRNICLVEPSNARRLSASELSLPIHPFLGEEEIEKVIAACVQASKGNVGGGARLK